MKGKKELWIFGAVRSELEWLIGELDADPVGGWKDHMVSRALGMTIRLGITGVGLASACFALGRFLSLWPAPEAIMVGSCGGFPGSGLTKGELVVATSEVISEAGVLVDEGIGDCGQMASLGMEKEIPLCEELSRCLWECACRIGKARMGKMVTVASSSGNETQARKRAVRFAGLAENMEGYCLAWAGREMGIRVAEIRGVSNEAGNRDKNTWDLIVAPLNAQKAVLEFLLEVRP